MFLLLPHSCFLLLLLQSCFLLLSSLLLLLLLSCWLLLAKHQEVPASHSRLPSRLAFGAEPVLGGILAHGSHIVIGEVEKAPAVLTVVMFVTST